MSRKDSKGMFAAVLGQLNESEAPAPAARGKINSPHLLKVAAGVRELQDRHSLAEKMLGEGEHILEFDAHKIEPSPIADRFDGAFADEAIADIAASIRESGQVVPGLVRPLGGDRYQIVYGRRRLAAAKSLGIRFKAVVRELSDEDAIILQGAENVGREELTFIEKCAFARAQERAGFRRDTICASLATGKSHVSEMIKIASSIPVEVLAYIGSAPEIGRGRWSELARMLEIKPQRDRAFDFVARERPAGDANIRFNKLLAWLGTKSTEMQSPSERQQRRWTADNGKLDIAIRSNAKGMTIALESEQGRPFGAWISDNLDRLYADFRRSQKIDATGD